MMNRILLVLVTLAVSVSISSGQTKGNKTSGGNIRNAIEAANKRFAEALGKGEAGKIADMYADGARVLPPNSPMVQERQNIQAFWQTIIGMGAKLSLSTVTVEAHGDVAHEVGTYEMILPDNKLDSGKYVVVWKRENGDWKLAVDIWNSDMPASSK